MNENCIEILIVDDHTFVRQGIQNLLESQPDFKVVGTSGSGKEAVQLERSLRPHVILLDLLLPDLSGLEVLRELRASGSESKVLMLTSEESESSILEALRAGALSFLLKDVDAEVLIDAVRKTAAGQAVIHPRATHHLIRAVSLPATPQPAYHELSDRELQVLKEIAKGQTNAQIANTLFLSEKTVKWYVSSLLQKLSLEDRTQAAVYAWRNGLAEP